METTIWGFGVKSFWGLGTGFNRCCMLLRRISYGIRVTSAKTELFLYERRHSDKIRFGSGIRSRPQRRLSTQDRWLLWNMPCRTAFKHRSAMVEQAYKKWRLGWNTSLPRHFKLRMLQAIFPAVLIHLSVGVPYSYGRRPPGQDRCLLLQIP